MHKTRLTSAYVIAAILALVVSFAAAGAQRGAASVLRMAPSSPSWVDAAPADEIEKDWMMQDRGVDVSACFRSQTDASIEVALTERVLLELKQRDEPRRAGAFRREM